MESKAVREQTQFAKLFGTLNWVCGSSPLLSAMRKGSELSNLSYWGYTLILDIKGAAKKRIKDENFIQDWTRSFLNLFNDESKLLPNIFLMDENIPESKGYLVSQVFNTGIMNVRFCDKTGDAYLDVLSNVYIDKDDIERNFKEWFNPKAVRATLLARQAA